LAWALYHIRKKKSIAFGILYYFITFSIVSNLFFPIGTNMAERFMFMPSLGFCLIVANLLYELGKKWSDKKTDSGFTNIYLGIGALTIVFSWMTFQRNFDWKNNYTLFSKDIVVSENSGKINTDLAVEMINQAFPINSILKEGNTFNENDGIELQLTDDEKKELLLNAIQYLNKALEIHPMSNLAWFKMANAHHFLGEMESNNPKENVNNLNIALAAYEVAEKYKGKDTTITNFKSICNMDIGKLQGQKLGNIPKCIQFLEKAKALNPKNAEAYLLLGTAYSIKNDYEKSISNTKNSLDLRPNDRDTKKNLATAYQQYAYAVPAKKSNLLLAEKLLLEVLKEEESLPNNDELKKEGMLRTLDLLIRNYSIQGNNQKATLYQKELEKVR